MFCIFSFPPPYKGLHTNMSWLYDALDYYWQKWLPPSTSSTVRYGGFYSVLAHPGFRIISVNMNYCHNKNW